MIESKLSIYSRIRIYEGDSLKQPRFLEELYSEDFQDWGPRELTEYIRKKYGNQIVHARCYGNPKRKGNDWFIPPILRAVQTEKEKELENSEVAVLRARIDQLQQTIDQGNHKQDGPVKDVKFEEIRPQRKSIVDRIDEFFDALGDQATNAIFDIATKKIIDAFIPQGFTMPPYPPPGFADSPQQQTAQQQEPEIVELDIPREVLDYFNLVDWDKTNWKQLLIALKATGLLTMKS